MYQWRVTNNFSMSAPVAFCPRCRKEVAFIKAGSACRCPLCGFQYETQQAGKTERSVAPGVVSGIGIFLRFVLILAAIVMVFLSVAFVGCVALLKGR